MESSYHVFIMPFADQKLASHMEFLARVSEEAATRLYESYKEAINILENNPRICPPYISRSPLEAELRYRLFSKRYRIVFEIIDKAVYIYDIQDCRQDTWRNLI